jgi:hypothetical protein
LYIYDLGCECFDLRVMFSLVLDFRLQGTGNRDLVALEALSSVLVKLLGGNGSNWAAIASSVRALVIVCPSLNL